MDPLGPLLFALTLHPMVKKIVDVCSLEIQSWYLDDRTIIGDTLQVAKAFKIIQEDGVGLGLYMNVSKTELYCPSPDSRSFELFPSHISRPPNGVQLLGGPVSTNSGLCMDMVHKRVQKIVRLMEDVSKLEDPQCELLLLRNCTGVSRLYFTLRTTMTGFMDSDAETFDTHLFQFLRRSIRGDGPGYGLLQHRLVTLPLKYGGLGTYSMSDTRTYCYLASCLQTFAF